jgi:hypothetical protein
MRRLWSKSKVEQLDLVDEANADPSERPKSDSVEAGVDKQTTEPVPVQRTPRSTKSVIHGRTVRSLATNREPAVGG